MNDAQQAALEATPETPADLELWIRLDELEHPVGKHARHGQSTYPLGFACASGARPTTDRRKLTERAGFEPAVQAVPVRRFSKPLVSATHPPLHATPLRSVFPCAAERRYVSARGSSSSVKEHVRDNHPLELGLDWSLGDGQKLGLSTQIGLDGDSHGEAIGAKISYMIEFGD